MLQTKNTHKRGHCPQKRALPTKEGIARKRGHCPQKRALPAKEGIARKRGQCPQKQALPLKEGIAPTKSCIYTQAFQTENSVVLELDLQWTYNSRRGSCRVTKLKQTASVRKLC